MNETEIFQAFPIFTEMSRNHLLQLGQYMERRQFAAGETVFNMGDRAASFHGVIDGGVDLVLLTRDEIVTADVRFEDYARTRTEIVERQIVVDTIEAGEVFGWSALLPAGRFTSKALCAAPSTLFALPGESMRAFFRQHPQLGYAFMERLTEIVSNRLAKRTAKLIDCWEQAFNADRI